VPKDKDSQADDFVTDGYRGSGKRFVLRADEKLIAFDELGNSHSR
jgi:hypothetical protein